MNLTEEVRFERGTVHESARESAELTPIVMRRPRTLVSG